MASINDTVLNGPSLVAPDGVHYDFQHPANLDTVTWVVLALTVTLSTLAMTLRFVMKLYVLRAREIEDYLAAIGWLLTIAFTVLTVFMVREGAGVHQWDVQLKHLSRMLYYFQIIAIIYCLATMFIKLSILVQYVRIFVPPGQRNFMYWCCWIIGVGHVLLYIPGAFIWAFLCTPVEAFYKPWLVTEGEAVCLNSGAANIFGGVFNCITVAAMIVLPLITLWQLNISRKQKIRLSSIFMIGIFAFVASLARTYYAVRLDSTKDQSYYIQLMTLWIAAEFATTIVCSCLPSFPILFRQAWSQLKRGFRRTIPSFSPRRPSHSVTIRLDETSTGKGMASPSRRRLDNTMRTRFSEIEYPGTVHINGGRRTSDLSLETDRFEGGGILVIRDFILEEVTSTYVSRQTV